ncbi:PDZ domain-containing protein [Thalassospira sp. HF15]|uniref:S41 family peptidase n=1 Tax=Thalassospira sp. HF15 TaxID=2722755 RepID=UPI00143036EC|nr:S41 family peptidase [Thalassospira sp. HF15]NIY74518.1 PDZ domain-containing protein [Thalassospira sp. HF15]
MSVLLTACESSKHVGVSSPDDPRTHELISQTIELVATRYIDPISREQILVNTLDGLSTVDDAIRVDITPSDLVLQYDGRTVDRIALPAMSGDANEHENLQVWAEITLHGLASYRMHSSELRSASTKDIESALISGAIRNLDRYSRYEGPERAENARNRRDGYIGIGVRVVGGTGYPIVKLVHAESPAARAGLNPGDQILTINGQDMYGKASRYTADLLHGEEGSSVLIEVNSANSAAITPMEILRERVIDRTVFAEIRDNILIARLSSFNSATASTLADNIMKAKLYDGGLNGVILDLRGNRGGLLQQGVAVADLFLEDGPIGKTFSRVTAARHIFKAETGDLTAGAPLVVLIDGRTASSAELVAAALQDRHRAVLIGSTSFGKGSVQAINDLPNHGTLTFTWSRMTAPSGYTFDRIGLFPAICTQTDAGNTAIHQVAHALSQRDKIASVMMKWRNLDYQDEKSRRELRNVCPASTNGEAFDVDVALELLKNRREYKNLAYAGQEEIADTFPSQ